MRVAENVTRVRSSHRTSNRRTYRRTLAATAIRILAVVVGAVVAALAGCAEAVPRFAEDAHTVAGALKCESCILIMRFACAECREDK
jgi:hypothetical protein